MSKANLNEGHRDQAVTFRTILVPIDFSSQSLEALDYACNLARRFGGELHVLYVLEPDYAYAVPYLLEMPALTAPEEAGQRVRAELKSVAADCSRAGPPAIAHARIGRAFDQVCKLATEIKADLIVLATHGRTGLKRVLLGSTAERIVRHTPSPVLVVRTGEKRAEATEFEIEKILVPTDFSGCSRDGLSYAIALAKTMGSRLVLLHALKVLPTVMPDRFAPFETMPSLATINHLAREQMANFVAAVDFEGVPFETKVAEGHPAHEICDYAESCAADLIVTSTHGVTGLAHVLIGSVAEHVVRHARCPVLVVPQRRPLGGAE